MPAALARSGLLGVKLPLWLVDTVLGFLLLSPMASMDWLRLRMTLCGRRGGREEAWASWPPYPWETSGVHACAPLPPVPFWVTLGSPPPPLKHQLPRVSHKRQANGKLKSGGLWMCRQQAEHLVWVS